MKKYFTLLMLVFSFHTIADTDVTVFGERFNDSEYLAGPWYGPMDFSELPSLEELGVERYDALRISLDTARFDLVLNAIGFKKIGQIKKEIPVVIVLYSDQLLMDSPAISFDNNTVNAVSVYTLSSLKYGSTTHRLYEPKQSKLKPIKGMTFKTLDVPECSTVMEFGLHWLSGEDAPQHATTLVINNMDVGEKFDNGSKQFGDFRKILKKAKSIDKKGTKKRKANNHSRKHNILSEPLTHLINLEDDPNYLSRCGNLHFCPKGDSNCNTVKVECNDGNGGGGGGWYTISTQSASTIINSFIQDSALYSIKNYMANSSESNLVIRAYDAWDHVQVNATTIPLYYELLPALIGKYDLLSANISSGIVVDSTVKSLLQQVINYHRSTGDSNFESHLDYLQNKIDQYQMKSVYQVNASMYPGTNDDPLIQ
ncbi:MAG: hypothetical protein ACI8WB_000759 [Phenylobacterium sp.]|jgi:hypothetical protein